ncbi:MAG TPA: FAD-dependent monooxygenase [Candidatus Acidoferrales bacterium]|nr:FAD-dependent monooxygenase [Candidatus Acidoferrales bacterium]
MAPSVDVLVIGAGPAGIASAIAASLRGLRATVVDGRKPPIDKACGEGLLPLAVSSLRRLGIPIRPPAALPFVGIRFADGKSSASAAISCGDAFGLRRTLLQQLLIERAGEVGVSFQWGAPVASLEMLSARSADPIASNRSRIAARIGSHTIACRWLVGADGQNSMVRKWAGLDPRRPFRRRFGFRRHYRVAPWTNYVEAHWGHRAQMILTPTGADEICISFMTSEPHLRIERALVQFPEVAVHLRGAAASSPEIGSLTALGRARAATRGSVALVGDASCTVDGVSGQGLALAFQEAVALGEALAGENLSLYEEAHRRITDRAMRMARLMLLMDRSAWIRRKALRLFEANPALYARMIAAHTGDAEAEDLSSRDIFGLGWGVLRT